MSARALRNQDCFVAHDMPLTPKKLLQCLQNQLRSATYCTLLIQAQHSGAANRSNIIYVDCKQHINRSAMSDELSWLMQAGLFVHKRDQEKKLRHDELLPDSQSGTRKGAVEKILLRKKEEKACRDELVEFVSDQAVCTRCGSCELEKLVLLKGGCSHLLCAECLSGIQKRQLMLPTGLMLTVCPACKTDIAPDAVCERPAYLIDFLEDRTSKAARAANEDTDYRSIVAADIHMVSRVYWTRMRFLLCQQSEVLAASYANFQEREIAVQKSMGDAEDSEQSCAKAKAHLDDVTREYENALRSFESLETNVSGVANITLDEARPLNLKRFQSANTKFLALKKMQSAATQHDALQLALRGCQDALRQCEHLHNAARAAFDHCSKNMDVSYTRAFRQFDMIKMQLRETRSLLPDATGVTKSERDMDEQFTLHTTIIRDLDDAKWHFQQNLVFPVDIPINVELTLKALEEELRAESEGPESKMPGTPANTAEEQVASLHAALKFDGFISPQRWELFPTKIVPDDYPTIQEAVKSLWRSCGRVIVKAGTFKEYVLLEGLVKICCEDAMSTVCITPLSENQNTAIELIGGFCMISNVAIRSTAKKSDAPLVFCRSGHIHLERCVMSSELAIIAHAIGAKSGCHFDECKFFGGQECNGLVRMDWK